MVKLGLSRLVPALLLMLCAVGSTDALYSAFNKYMKPPDQVEKLTKSNWGEVVKGDQVWIVEFFAPWCGHCKALAPEYKKTAEGLAGIARVGAVDMTKDEEVGRPYSVTGFPTLKIFVPGGKAIAYEGKRDAKGMIGGVLDAIGELALGRIGVGKAKPYGSSGGKPAGKGGGKGKLTPESPEIQAIMAEPTVKKILAKMKTQEGARKTMAKVQKNPKMLAKFQKLMCAGIFGEEAKAQAGCADEDEDSDVVKVTEANFEAEVLNTKDIVMVEFFAPWCGHCKALKPEWDDAAKRLKGTAKLVAVDATAEKGLGGEFKVEGFPTIKVWGPGRKKRNKFSDYNGPRTASGIVEYVTKALAKMPLHIPQIVTDAAFQSECVGSTLCLVSFLPNIMDTSAKARKAQLKMLSSVGKQHRGTISFVWLEGGAQPELEGALHLGFGFPAVVILSPSKKRMAVNKQAFDGDSIGKFIAALLGGKQGTNSYKALPALKDTTKWDGKDAVVEQEEDIDLSELMGDLIPAAEEDDADADL